MSARGAALTFGVLVALCLIPGPSTASVAQIDLGWGATYQQLTTPVDGRPVTFHRLLVDPERVQPAVAYSSQGIGTTESLLAMTRGANALAGINGNFFDPASSLPVGFLLDDRRPLSTPYGTRGTLGIGFFGRLHFLNPQIELFLETADRNIPVDGVNRPLLSDGLIVYTPEYRGPMGPVRNKMRTALVRDGRVMRIGTDIRPIDRDEQLVAATGDAVDRLESVLPAEPVQLDYRIEPERYLIRDALQAGPTLIRDGAFVSVDEGFDESFRTKRAARSAVARLGDGRLLFTVAEQGGGSHGVDLRSLAEELLSLGAEDALALDGGGSSGLVVRRGVGWRTAGDARDVPVALVLRPQ
ncbi:MAG: phosphodiester glycosidase family protein [Candidatus Bipolaricaulia bacterium]